MTPKRIFVHSGTVQRTHHRSRFHNAAGISMRFVSPSLLPRSVFLLSFALKKQALKKYAVQPCLFAMTKLWIFVSLQMISFTSQTLPTLPTGFRS